MRQHLLATLAEGGKLETAAAAAANIALPISKFTNAGVISSDGPGQIMSSFSFPKISNVQIYFTINGPGISKMTWIIAPYTLKSTFTVPVLKFSKVKVHS